MTAKSEGRMNNVIILTSGLSGSSVLTGLLAQAGFWTGETFRKADYDTYENLGLIELNKRIFREAGYDGGTDVFSEEAIRRIAAVRERVDPEPYRAFIRGCDAHRPWVWKDPRLWLTIRFWEPLLDLESCSFLLLTREDLQAWISMILRRQIWTYARTRRYTDGINGSILEFLEASGARRHRLSYEDLIVHPDATIEALNGFLGTRMTERDLAAVYNGPLRRRARGFRDLLTALLIYGKNYGARQR